MKNFTKELKNILMEDSISLMEEYGGTPILSPDEVRGRANTTVILTNQAPKELLALAGPSREAILLNFKPLMITFPYQKGVFKVQPDDIVFENYHSGRDITEAGSEETSYEKFFAAAMKKFGVSSPIELSPEDTKKFFNYVDKNWDAEEESDGSKNEILPALARGAMAVGNVASAIGSMVDMDEVSRKSQQKAQRKKDIERVEKEREREKAKADKAKSQSQRDRELKQRAREREAEAKRKENQERIKSKAPDEKAKQKAMKDFPARQKRKEYEKEAERKAAERTREKEQKRAEKEKERERKKKVKKKSTIGKKLGLGMDTDAAATKVAGAASSALSKYKSKGSGI